MRKFISGMLVALVAAAALPGQALAAYVSTDLSQGTAQFAGAAGDLQSFLWTLLPYMVGIALVTIVVRFITSKVRRGGK